MHELVTTGAKSGGILWVGVARVDRRRHLSRARAPTSGAHEAR